MPLNEQVRAVYQQELARAEAAFAEDEKPWGPGGFPPVIAAVAAVLGIDRDKLHSHVEGIHGWEPHDEGYEAAVWAAAECTEHEAELASGATP